MMSKYKDVLENFYRTHNPSCLDSIDEILNIFRGREDDLFHVLEEKYGTKISHYDTEMGWKGPENSRETKGDPEKEAVRDTGTFGEASIQNYQALLRRLSDALKAKTDETTKLLEHVEYLEGELEKERRSTEVRRDAALDRMKFEKQSGVIATLESRVAELEKNYRESQNANYVLRKENIIALAEKKAVQRHRKNEDLVLKNLRSRVIHLEERESSFISQIAALRLQSSGPLPREEFDDIIKESLEHLKVHYEEKLFGVMKEMDNIYDSYTVQVEEKDAIIAALRSQPI